MQVNIVSCKAKRVAFVNVTIKETDALSEKKADVSNRCPMGKEGRCFNKIRYQNQIENKSFRFAL